MPDHPPEPEDVYARLIAELVDQRRRLGLRQQDVADQLGRPQAFVSRYETHERRLDVADYLTVARALGVDPAGLLAKVLGGTADAEGHGDA